MQVLALPFHLQAYIYVSSAHTLVIQPKARALAQALGGEAIYEFTSQIAGGASPSITIASLPDDHNAIKVFKQTKR